MKYIKKQNSKKYVETYKKMNKIVLYQIGFWIVYCLDLITTLINPPTSELNPLFILAYSMGGAIGVIMFKISGIPIIAFLFYKLKDKNKLLKYSKIGFYLFLIVNILNLLNYLVVLYT